MMTASFSLFMMFRLGYDAFHNGWVFAFVGVISAIIQGGLIGRLVKKFGEPPLIIVGALLFTASLAVIPFVQPSTGLITILVIGAVTSIGQALSAPTLSSLASKSASASGSPRKRRSRTKLAARVARTAAGAKHKTRSFSRGRA